MNTAQMMPNTANFTLPFYCQFYSSFSYSGLKNCL
ncbi:hypothetical protein T03_11514 [Trichinella britovi]|uniref:Uncharacterized protein n=1 Tax=Trichinella britovi TaxID=45882 RepID=A0A0V1AP38_TRIBR|nr:hypothetical protein T03_11514 [Trichinella britovi]